jgi:hypothetical protein
MYSYVRNNPLSNTDSDGRNCFTSVSSCGSFLLGGLKALANAATSGVLNTPTTLTNLVISPFTSYRFQNVFPEPAPVTDSDEREGAESVTATLIFSPLAEAGAAGALKAGEAVTDAATNFVRPIAGPRHSRRTWGREHRVRESHHGCGQSSGTGWADHNYGGQ